jgi:hypothetical protein
MQQISVETGEWKTAFDVASSIEWSKGRKIPDMNYMEKNFAILETIAHLIHMEKIGRIESKYNGETIMYRFIANNLK